ncbi:Tetratricopeptide TPR 4 [Novosphingobium resinovorum]|uniref:Tetratricopeptide TPR 4 n=1 Tax=Novosphingobium resinovorum TaxID=158500 RepID=A0A031JZA1_9SPHN|nr:tetratricopeptide repeat protein [Novosphingobium resinovorum]EZP82254.1 Tetratricopeptide TPR 4 [Novosphingobium resinovorum]
MSSLLLLLPLMAQVGPASSLPSSARPYASQLPLEIIEKKDKEDRDRRAREAQNVAMPAARSSAGCMSAVEANPEKSAELARSALADAIGREQVRAGLCLGVALSDLDRWDEARTAFTNARDAADPADHASRARLGAMAGNAALAAGQAGQALSLLAPAATDAKIVGDADLTASIALDRARGLVAVKQPDEAANALAEARAAQPDNAQAWLLSATLSRRQDKLAQAQTQIEKAASLAPQDPEIGLEAGVIAMLSHNDAAARRSWESVVAAAPSSDAAVTAKQYLSQLGSPDPAK